MKKISINHKVEITNNVMGFTYLVIQYTKLHSEEIENEHVEVYCYNNDTGFEVFKEEFKYGTYPQAKKKFKNVILECLPC